MARPREFDRAEALDRALDVFWYKGYSATSMADLMTAMNLSKASIYGTYKDKQSLFSEALTVYMDRNYHAFKRIFSSHERGIEGVEAFLISGALRFSDQKNPGRGCFVMNTAVELGPHNTTIRDKLSKHRDRVIKLISQAVSLGQEQGDIRLDISSAGITAQVYGLFSSFLTNLRMDSNEMSIEETAKAFIQSIRQN